MKIITKLILLIVLVCGLYYVYDHYNNINIDKYLNKFKNITSELQNKTSLLELINDEDIDKDFLNWINKNYKIKNKIIKLLKTKEYTKDLWKEVTGYTYNSLKAIYEENITKINTDSNISISFIGDVSLADNWYIMPAYDERDNGIEGILSKDVINILSTSTYSIANNEFTISDRRTPLSGKAFTFRGSKERLSIYNEMGIDLVTLANNHVYDYGLDAFNDMLDALNEYNIPHIGAGTNITEASKEYSIILNGYKISFLNASRAEKNILTPGATETEAGVFRCYDSSLLEQRIKEVKQTSDYVITLVHYGKEGYHDLEDEQIASSKRYIDAGSDAVIGTHAHTLQGVEYYSDKLIAYNLGDFIFNEKTEDTGIMTLNINADGNMTYQFTPCVQENMYTKVVSGDDKQRIISDMNSWSINACMDEYGNISEGSC